MLITDTQKHTHNADVNQEPIKTRYFYNFKDQILKLIEK